MTASLLISKLQAGARENVLSRALRDLGRLVKTQFILRWIENPDYRRRIHRQLNKGEALHALCRFLFFAHEGKVQRRQADQQTNQVLCLNLVTNAIVTWNTVYMNAAIERLRAEGRIGRDIDLGHLSPALYGHVNPTAQNRTLRVVSRTRLRGPCLRATSRRSVIAHTLQLTAIDRSQLRLLSFAPFPQTCRSWFCDLSEPGPNLARPARSIHLCSTKLQWREPASMRAHGTIEMITRGS